MKPFQHEMPIIGTVYNLSPETGLDMDRVLEDQHKALASECAAKEFFKKMQRTLEECPGFIGADVPAAVGSTGRIVVEPGSVSDAMKYLKRRFHVAENLGLS